MRIEEPARRSFILMSQPGVDSCWSVEYAGLHSNGHKHAFATILHRRIVTVLTVSETSHSPIHQRYKICVTINSVAVCSRYSF